MKHIIAFLLFLCASCGVRAQGNVDNTGAMRTSPFRQYESEPGRCKIGEYYENTATGILRRCTALNTWTDFGTAGTTPYGPIVFTASATPQTITAAMHHYTSQVINTLCFESTTNAVASIPVSVDPVTFAVTLSPAVAFTGTCTLFGTASIAANGWTDNGTMVTTPRKVQIVGLQVYANNAAAIAGGLTVGMLYRTGADPDPLMVVH